MAGAPTVSALHILNTGYFKAPGWALNRRGGWKTKKLPILTFALELEQAVYLVDAGFHKGFAERLGQVLGRARTRPEWSVLERLKSAGIERSRLTGVLMTHLDGDHVGALPQLSDVPVHVAAATLEEARKPTRFRRFRYPRKPLAALTDNARPYDYRETPDLDLGPLAQAHDLRGDGSIQLVSLPGHAPGHAGVLFRLGDEGKRVLLCGDAAFTTVNIETSTLGAFPRRIAYDLEQASQTLEALNSLCERPDLTIIPSHNPPTGERSLEAVLTVTAAAEKSDVLGD